MRTLVNTTVYAGNDISVTTGNADGWVLLPRETSVTERPANNTRRGSETKKPKGKRKTKRK